MADGPPALRALEAAHSETQGIDGRRAALRLLLRPRHLLRAPTAASPSRCRRRRFPIVGKGTGIFSFVHVDDAARATLAAVEGGAPGVYNVVDDDPAPLSEWLPAYAEAIGAKRPRRVPALLARLIAGKDAAAMATALRGASNEKAKRELGWAPKHPSWRQGFREALG